MQSASLASFKDIRFLLFNNAIVTFHEVPLPKKCSWNYFIWWIEKNLLLRPGVTRSKFTYCLIYCCCSCTQKIFFFLYCVCIYEHSHNAYCAIYSESEQEFIFAHCIALHHHHHHHSKPIKYKIVGQTCCRDGNEWGREKCYVNTKIFWSPDAGIYKIYV